MRRIVAAAAAALALVGCGSLSGPTDPGSDAPDAPRPAGATSVAQLSSYREALATWQSAEDINAWIGARFEYDPARALRLSETERQRSGTLPIPAPEDFFLAPRGVCVDLARLAVEALRVVDPASKPTYLMIEFDPVSVSGNVLRRHWVVAFERDGRHYVFADSRHPGRIAGPYASTQAFIDAYASDRGRRIVGFRELASYARQKGTLATRQVAEPRP